MTISQYALGLVRLAAILVPLVLAAHQVRLVGWHAGEDPDAHGPLAWLTESVIALGLLLVGAELLGLVSLLKPGSLTVLLVLAAAAAWLIRRASRGSGERTVDAPPSPPSAFAVSPAHEPARAGTASASRPVRDPATAATLGAVAIVLGQWTLQTANAYGSGMYSFDTLWYHMPFAAGFAQSASVTAIQFTQADPITAYYPANAELLHAVGIVAVRGDLLSPAINLLWLVLGLLSAWCVGRPWRAERETLAAGALALGLPLLAATQPGQAFNDVAGLATVIAAVALLVNARDRPVPLAGAGLALGFAAGTKWTFLIPAVVLIAGFVAVARGRRLLTFAWLAVPCAVTGGWWYLRDLVHTGNPFGLRIHVGPLVLSGPVSPLAAGLQQSIVSQLADTSLWGSRIAPGFAHALGPVWPIVVLGAVAATVGALTLIPSSTVRIVALAAAAGGLAYLFLPSWAAPLQTSTSAFELELRYAAAPLTLAFLLVPIIVRVRAPDRLVLVAPAFCAVLVVAQFEPSLWPAQTARHALALIAALLVLGLAVGGGGTRLATWGRRARPGSTAVVVSGIVAVLAALGYVVERHYYARRYLAASAAAPGLAAVYHWAQGVSRQRIALYGTVEQYPLAGARVTNDIAYLGRHTSGGGYEPISTCTAWRRTMNAGHYAYLVLSPGPTAPAPAAWTQGPTVHLILSPAPGTYVFRLMGPLARC